MNNETCVFSVSGNDCKESWNKLRNAYIQARHRRATKSGQAFLKWKFEDEMAFLNSTLTSRKSRRNTEYSFDDADIIDIIQEEAIKEENEEIESDRKDFQYFPSQNAISTTQTVEAFDDSTNISKSSPTLPEPFSEPARPFLRKRPVSSAVQDIITVMKDNQRLRAELDRVPADKKKDECDLFFLSLAKSVKKLRPREQIRVKMEVSQIVWGAELNATRR